MSDTFTKQDAEDAGWVIVHEGIDEEVEGATLNASHWRAEKYLNQPGRAGAFVEAAAPTEERLMEAIRTREQQFGIDTEGSVLLPAEDTQDADLSDENTFERVSDAEFSARGNDVLTVLSDPSDQDSEPVQKIIVGGEEIDPTVYETDANDVPEAGEPLTDDDGNLVPTDEQPAIAQEAGIEAAKEQRDNADSVESADGADAAQAVAQARHDALTGDEGDSGNDSEKVQPEAGEATDASDSEQQSQVPDSEAASSDSVSTNTTDEFPKDNLSQPEVFASDTDAEAPAGAPNAPENASNTAETEIVSPSAPVDAGRSNDDEPQSTPTE